MVCADMMWSDPEDEYFTAVLLLGVVQCVCVCACSCNCTKVCADMVWSDSEDEDFTAVLLLGVVQCVCVCGNNITVPCVQTSCSQIQTTRTSLQCYSLMLYSVCVYVCACACVLT